MIDIPVQIKDPTRKYKIAGLISLVFGFILVIYTLILLITQMAFSFSAILPGIFGYTIMVLGVFLYMIPSFMMAKYFFQQILKPEGKQLHPLFVLDEFIELYESYGNLYYLLGDYKRSEIFYGIMVLLKQQQYNPELVINELQETRKLLKKIRTGKED